MTNCVHENDAVNSMYTDINNIFYTYFVVQVSEYPPFHVPVNKPPDILSWQIELLAESWLKNVVPSKPIVWGAPNSKT